MFYGEDHAYFCFLLEISDKPCASMNTDFGLISREGSHRVLSSEPSSISAARRPQSQRAANLTFLPPAPTDQYLIQEHGLNGQHKAPTLLPR